MSDQQSVPLHDLGISPANRQNWYLWKEPPASGTCRTIQVFQCHACGFQTNLVDFAQGQLYGNRRVAYLMWCRYTDKPWHKQLERKIVLTRDEHPASYLQELQAEIDTLRRSHRPRHNVSGAAIHLEPPLLFRSHREPPNYRITELESEFSRYR